jgi:hypothetical protein
MPDRETGMAAGASPVLFVSYTPADEDWASWIAWELESAGYRVVLQAWDFVPGTNFVDFFGEDQIRAYLRNWYGEEHKASERCG